MSDVPQPPGMTPQSPGITPPPPPRAAPLPPPQVPASKPKSSSKLKPGVVIGIVGGLIGVAGLGGVVVAATGGDDDPPSAIAEDTNAVIDVDDPIDVSNPGTASPNAPTDTEPERPEPDSTDPGSTEPDSTEPDTTEPDATEPDSTGPTPTLPQDTAPPESRPEELPSDTIEIIDPSSGSVPAPPPATAPVTAPPVVTDPPPPPPTDPAPIPESGSTDEVTLPAGWDVVDQSEGYLAFSNGSSFMEFYFLSNIADEALGVTQVFVEEGLSSYVSDLAISEPVPIEPPTSSVTSAGALKYQGVIATQTGSTKVEGAVWGFVFTDGSTMVAATTDGRGESASNIDAQVDILILILGA